jgi:hypothetical protein
MQQKALYFTAKRFSKIPKILTNLKTEFENISIIQSKAHLGLVTEK